VCQRHDVNYNIAVEYHAVNNVSAHVDSVNHSKTTKVVNGDETSVRLTLSSRLSYHLLVKSQTSAGVNTSLHAQPVYIGTSGM